MLSEALEGAGNDDVGSGGGEWIERGNGVLHVRRRLRPDEADLPLMDLRGTKDGLCRINALLLRVPQLERFAIEEWG